MNNDDYFSDQNKYPKLGLLNEDIIKNEYDDSNKKKNDKYQHIELSDYKQLPGDQDEYFSIDSKASKPTFNARGANNNNMVFAEEKKEQNTNNTKNNDGKSKIESQKPPMNQQQKSNLPQPVCFPNQIVYQQPMYYGGMPCIQPYYHYAVTCPKCSLYQAVPTNSNGFICPRCNNIISVIAMNNLSRTLVCDKCKSNVIFQIGTSPLIECSFCKTINYAAVNDPQNLYGPKK